MASSTSSSALSSYVLSAGLSSHNSAVRDLAFSPDEQLLLTLEERNQVHVWKNSGNDTIHSSTNSTLASSTSTSSSTISTIEKKTDNDDDMKIDSLHSASSTSGKGVWMKIGSYRLHAADSLTFVLANVDGWTYKSVDGTDGKYPSYTFMSGGGDKCAIAFNAFDGKILSKLSAHANVVGSISKLSSGFVITGSWDGFARAWCDGEVSAIIEKHPVTKAPLHEHAVEVLGLDSGYCITASANKNINIFFNGELKTVIPNAHDHTIRKLISHPFGFLSIGNDGFIKIWNLEGKNVHIFSSHSQSDVKFLYGVDLIENGKYIVTCGEDGTARILHGNSGDLIQTISHPGAVRSVKVMKNGDILTACADKVCRIFTKAKERAASQKEIEEYEELIRLVQAGGKMKTIDSSTLPDEKILEKPGKKDQQLIVVNVKGRNAPIVYQWQASEQRWQEIGEAIGSANDGKSSSHASNDDAKSVDGKKYDVVTEVEVNENHKVPLGFNRDDDPEEVVENFMALYSLPDYVRQQIIDHIKPMVDSVAVQQKKARKAAERERHNLLHVPSWSKGGGFHMYGQVNISGMRKKFPEVNSKLNEEKSIYALNEKQEKILQEMITIIENPVKFHVVALSDDALIIIKKMLQWPLTATLPVVDFLRMIFLIPNACDSLGNDGDVLKKLLEISSGGTETHRVLTIKLTSNLLSKRSRGNDEKLMHEAASSSSSSPSSAAATAGDSPLPPAFSAFLSALFAAYGAEWLSSESENFQSAWIMLIYDVVVWLGRMNVRQCSLYSIIVRQLTDSQLTKKEFKQRALFHSIQALASIASISPASRQSVLAASLDVLQALLSKALSSDNTALKEVAADAMKIFGLQ